MFSKFLFLILFVGLIGCSIDYKEANDKAVEKLNAQIKAEKFEEIYNDSYTGAKQTVSKTEFVERMREAFIRIDNFPK